MKKLIAFDSLLFLFLLFVLGCTTESEDNITSGPVVKKTLVNYTHETFRTSFPDTSSLHNISKTYSNNYSEDKRNQLLDYMRREVSKFGEDPNVFENVLSRTGCKLTGEYVLPTYAERAKYENQEAWIFQITVGLGEPVFGRCKCYALSLPNLDTLAYIGTR